MMNENKEEKMPMSKPGISIKKIDPNSKIGDISKKFEASDIQPSTPKPPTKPVPKKAARKIIKKKPQEDAILKMFESINNNMISNNAQMLSLNEDIKNKVMKLDVKLDSKISQLQIETSTIAKLANSNKGDIVDLVTQAEGLKSSISEINSRVNEMNDRNTKLEAELTELKSKKSDNNELNEVIPKGPEAVSLSEVVKDSNYDRNFPPSFLTVSKLVSKDNPNLQTLGARPKVLTPVVRPSKNPKFISEDEEAKAMFLEHRRMMGIRITPEDIKPFIDQSDINMASSMIYKAPFLLGSRIKAIKHKIAMASSIKEEDLEVVDLFITNKSYDIAWITMDNEESVQEIFRKTAHLRFEEFNAFPKIPLKALKRKKSIEAILINQKKLNSKLRYQIRNGINDLRIMIKFHEPNEYSSYKEVPICFIDPSNECHCLELTTKPSNSLINLTQKLDQNTTDSEGYKTVSNKRRHSFSPPINKKYRFVSPTKLNQVILGFVEGTMTRADIVEELTFQEDTELEFDGQLENSGGESSKVGKPPSVGKPLDSNDMGEETSIDSDKVVDASSEVTK